MIYCIWYPSGGFGHYINSVLSLYGDNFARPKNKHSFSHNGDSHKIDLVLPTFFKNPKDYNLPEIDLNKNYSVLIDNGINDESENFLDFFKGSEIIKICYTDYSWPVVAKTQILKALRNSLDDVLIVDERWPCQDPWAVREKYFLYLRDHELRHAWKSPKNYKSIDIQTLLNYTEFNQELQNLKIICKDFSDLHTNMLEKNYQYFSGVIHANQIINALKNNQNIDVSYIIDLWDQAVINYFIQLEFNIEVPANSYKDWFTNTEEMLQLL